MTEPKRRFAPLIYRLGAVSNWVVTIPAIMLPERVAPWIGLEDPELNYAFLLRIWAGMAFLWGVMFWEVAKDLTGRKAMLKYTWLEKCVTAASVTIAFAECQVGWKCFGMILFTDYLWIPLFLLIDLRTRGNPVPEYALAGARQQLGLDAPPSGQR